MSDHKTKKEVVVEERYCYEEERELTVHKTSMFSNGDGFTVYDLNGDIIFRVHSYGPIKHPVLLMDHFGKPLITLLPKRPTLHQRWEGFMGEILNHNYQQQQQKQKLIFSIWKSTMIGRSSTMMVQVHTSATPTMYQIEGSFSDRSCTIHYVSSSSSLSSPSSSSSSSSHGTSKVVMAQIKPKVESTRKLVLGRDVFSLVVTAGFDAALAMGLVLALDRIDGDGVASIERRHVGT